MLPLPTFRYHPDPVATGSIAASDKPCLACQQVRGFIYTGPVYVEADVDEAICPWCIADGSAHAQFDAEFVDTAGIGGDGDWDDTNPLSQCRKFFAQVIAPPRLSEAAVILYV
jgi:hypothetical protein